MICRTCPRQSRLRLARLTQKRRSVVRESSMYGICLLLVCRVLVWLLMHCCAHMSWSRCKWWELDGGDQERLSYRSLNTSWRSAPGVCLLRSLAAYRTSGIEDVRPQAKRQISRAACSFSRTSDQLGRVLYNRVRCMIMNSCPRLLLDPPLRSPPSY